MNLYRQAGDAAGAAGADTAGAATDTTGDAIDTAGDESEPRGADIRGEADLTGGLLGLGIDDEDTLDASDDLDDLDDEDITDATVDPLADVTVYPVVDVAAAPLVAAAASAAARVQQDTQGDIGTLNTAFQTGLNDVESTFTDFLTQGEAMFDNTINTAETATGLGDSDVGAAARIQQTAADVTTDVNAAVEDASHAFDATVEGANAQLHTLMSAFAPAGAAPAAAAARRLQRFR
jgi:hypothetical protein